MSRRKAELFNLSFLDLLTSALGAVIFLFVITPKGGAPAAEVQQAAVYIDTSQMQIFGGLHDSLKHKRVGDTLFAVLVDYKNMPKAEKPIAQPTPRPVPEQVKTQQERGSRPEAKKTEKTDNAPIVKKPEPEKPTPAPEKREQPVAKVPDYKGDAPSVPCKVSFEINWRSAEDNVDLFVCKGGGCVYGGRKRDNDIGQWDSGKSRNRLFGNDLRTNQEAVRQFDAPIAGEYKLYAIFKDSEKNRNTVIVNGLIYTQNEAGQESGATFSKPLSIGKERVLLGTVVLQKDGNFKFIKS